MWNHQKARDWRRRRRKKQVSDTSSKCYWHPKTFTGGTSFDLIEMNSRWPRKRRKQSLLDSPPGLWHTLLWPEAQRCFWIGHKDRLERLPLRRLRKCCSQIKRYNMRTSLLRGTTSHDDQPVSCSAQDRLIGTEIRSDSFLQSVK